MDTLQAYASRVINVLGRTKNKIVNFTEQSSSYVHETQLHITSLLQVGEGSLDTHKLLKGDHLKEKILV